MIQKERLTEQFFEFVKIGSESGNEKDMGERLVKECRDLGLEVVTDSAGASYGSNGFNVLAYLPGTMEGEPYLLSAHMDTVKPGIGIVPFIKDGVIMSGEDTILGGDDKSGICGILEAVQSPEEPQRLHFRLQRGRGQGDHRGAGPEQGQRRRHREAGPRGTCPGDRHQRHPGHGERDREDESAPDR